MAGVATDLFKLLCHIANQPSARITGKNLEEHFGFADPRKLMDDGMLISAPHNHDIDAMVDDEEQSRTIEFCNGGLMVFSPSSGWVPVEKNDLLVYEVNFDWLLHTVMKGLEISENIKPHVVMEDKIWFLGSAWLNKKKKTPVIFARMLSKRDVITRLRGYLQDHHACEPALVLTNTSNIPAYFELPNQNRIVLLSEAIDIESQRLAFKTSYLSNKMGFTPEHYGFSDSYRTLKTRDGRVFKFTKKRASILEFMDKAGRPLHQTEIMAESESSQDRLIDLFKNDPAWKVIFETDNKGYYWLTY